MFPAQGSSVRCALPALTQVPVAPASPERFRALVGEDYAAVEQAASTAQRVLEGRVVWHVNSTARGGGVAEMLQSLLAYARGAGVDVRWLTIGGDPDFFRITKRIHNHLHAADGDGGPLGSAERKVYERTLLEAADELVELVRDGDIVYIHDPQPAGLIPHVKSAGTKIVWRCHVGVDHPNDRAREAWDFLRPYIDDADAYVFSRKEFVWEGLDLERLWLVPPSIDAFSPKNEELGDEAVRAILNVIGLGAGDHFTHAVFERVDGSTARVDRAADLDQEKHLPGDAPLIAQVSRWDRLKDPVGVLHSFAEYVDSSEAHLVLAGPSVQGVADDPEGAEVLEEVRGVLAQLPAEVRSRVHLASLPMDDVQENAAMVNAIQRRAEVIVQKSLAEGFGLTVAEAMWKSKPVVAPRVGGIQDQIVDGESGVLVDDPADLAAVGAAITALLDDPNRARAIGEGARERIRHSFLGTRHLAQYMQLIEQMLRADA
jgi:trehalose synthase